MLRDAYFKSLVVVVDRVIDARLIALNGRGARNGHIPVTAITSAVTALAADVNEKHGALAQHFKKTPGQ